MKILVVEDERITASIEESIIKMIGHQVVAVVSSGEEAVTRAKELKPDLVLCDVELAGKMNGIEAAKTMAPTPVIFLTASPRDDLQGRVWLLKKDFKIDALREAIARATGKARALTAATPAPTRR